MRSTRYNSIRFRTPDGAWLAGDLIPSQGRARGAVLIASALGVSRRLYAPFASYLAEGGLTALLFDYRGTGESRPAILPGYPASLSDWAERDLPAALQWLSSRAPGLPLLYVGHSLGGQLLGLIPDPPVQAALLIGSQSGYWGHWTGLPRLAMAALWFVLVPASTRLFGYLPMRLARQGLDVPAPAAGQWAQWGRDPRYVGRYLLQRDGRSSFDFAHPLQAYAFGDDGYAPLRAVEALVAAYPRADTRLRFVQPAELGASSIGHFGNFRPFFRDTLWNEQRAWLLGHL